MLGRETGVGEEVLEELLSSRRSGEEARLWTNLRLDWVRNWDQSCQSAVLLSRLEHTGEKEAIFILFFILFITTSMIKVFILHGVFA